MPQLPQLRGDGSREAGEARPAPAQPGRAQGERQDLHRLPPGHRSPPAQGGLIVSRSPYRGLPRAAVLPISRTETLASSTLRVVALPRSLRERTVSHGKRGTLASQSSSVI